MRLPDLFRVFSLIDGAPADSPGGALHVPRHRQGAGRVDNPEHYGVLYAAQSEVAAVAERLQGFRGLWLGPSDLRVRLGGGRASLALARYTSRDGRECDLDLPRSLAQRKMVPSDVATRRRKLTQRWALDIWNEQRWGGVRFWSSLEAKWPVIARWSWDDVHVQDVEPLTVFHPATRQAAEFLALEIRRT